MGNRSDLSQMIAHKNFNQSSMVYIIKTHCPFLHSSGSSVIVSNVNWPNVFSTGYDYVILGSVYVDCTWSMVVLNASLSTVKVTL